VGSDAFVWRASEANVFDVLSSVVVRLKRSDNRARQVGINEEANCLRWERMETLLFRQFANKFECSADVVHAQVVLAFDLLKGHTASEASNHERNRHPGATDDGFAVADCRINNNSIVTFHNQLITQSGLDSKHFCRN
jgi:hypothetical protein